MSDTNQHHKSGNLKQSNKPTKIKASKNPQFRTEADDFKEPKSKSKKIALEARNDRINRFNQLRQNKMNEFIAKKKGLLDSDILDKSLNGSKIQSMSLSQSMTNLTALIDTRTYRNPPKLCALIALNEDCDLDLVMDNLECTILGESDFDVFNKNKVCIEGSAIANNKFNKINDNMWTAFVPTNLYKGKERISMFKTSRDIYCILDICKIADLIIFVTNCKKTDYANWKKDPDRFSNSIDSFGYEILSMLRAQGLPQHISIIQDLESIPEKHRTDVKKLFTRYIESELKPDKIFASNANDELKAIIRLICSLPPFAVSLDIKRHRSYMLCQKINVLENNNNNNNSNQINLNNANSNDLVDLELFGYLKGNTIRENNYLHITGFGDYLIADVENHEDPCPAGNQGVGLNSSMTGGNIKSSASNYNNNNMDLEGGNTKQSNKKNIDDDKVENVNLGNNLDNKPALVGNAEIVGNIAKKNEKNLESNLNKELDDIDFDINIKEDGEDISFDEDDEQEGDEENKISNKHILKTSLNYRTYDEMEFPDEVDTPIDVPARQRFSKYRGLESMKHGSWDPNENLPKEYKNIYSFENLRYTYKVAVRTAHEEGLKISGNYVKILIKNFNKDDLKYLSPEIPIIASTLLQHERKLCVMHFKIQLNYEFNEKIYNKQVVEAQYGFRRVLSRPLYSSEVGINSDKLKLEKFLEKDKFYIATIYSQLIYPFSPVLLFKPVMNINSLENGKLKMIASGSIFTSDSKTIILKKIVLTGYPIKIKKRKAVIRYMFFTPTDIHYFKPVQLSTKNGLRGHITESLGTHGYMKCVFSDFLKASDTICMNLYKRIFPKWFRESWKYKVAYGNKKDYMNYFTLEMEKYISKFKTRDDLDKEKQLNMNMNIEN